MSNHRRASTSHRTLPSRMPLRTLRDDAIKARRRLSVILPWLAGKGGEGFSERRNAQAFKRLLKDILLVSHADAIDPQGIFEAARREFYDANHWVGREYTDFNYGDVPLLKLKWSQWDVVSWSMFIHRLEYNLAEHRIQQMDEVLTEERFGAKLYNQWRSVRKICKSKAFVPDFDWKFRLHYEDKMGYVQV